MGYKIGYSGPKVDELLQKAFNSSVVNNGWVKYPSSESERCDLNTLMIQGNYSISFWNNGPIQLTTSGPMNISVTKDSADNTYYQTIYDAGKIYTRKSNEDGTFTNTWNEVQTDTEIDFGASTPINPKDDYVWIDTSGEVPVIKIFNEKTNHWVSVSPSDMAKESVYDPQGIKRDFNAFVNEKIEEADLESAADNYEKHLVATNEDGTPIHVTSEEKSQWLSSVSQSTADTIMNDFSTEMSELATSKVTEKSDYINGTLTTEVNSAKSKIEDHISDSSIHLTQEQIDLFDSKAAGDHKHILDGTVTVSTNNITGLIPIERIDPSVIERCFVINTMEEIYKLRKTDIQNGDSIYYSNNGSPTAWFVINEDALGEIIFHSSIISEEVQPDFNVIAYGNGKFVTCSRYNTKYFAYSSDGSNWALGQFTNAGEIYSICYGNGKFVACGFWAICYSIDGINWTELTAPRRVLSVVYGNNRFIITTLNSELYLTSTDGITWTDLEIGVTNKQWDYICFTGDTFIATTSAYIAYSNDGITWTESENPIGASIQQITYGNNQYICWSNNSLYKSTDNCVTFELINSNFIAHGLIFDNADRFLCFTMNSTRFGYSYDCIEWNYIQTSPEPHAWEAFCYGDGKIVLLSHDITVYYTPMEPFIQYAAPLPELTWENILEKPTSLSEYGEDVYTQEEIDALYNEIKTSLDESTTRANEINSKINTEKLGIDLRNAKVNDTFLFGKYQVESEDPWAIEWEVVHQDELYSYAQTKSIIDLRAFDGKESNNTDSDRKNYGNNNWNASNIAQYLNSDSESWYSAQHQYDAPPNSDNVYNNINPYDTHKGFLYYFTDTEKSFLQDMTLTLANPTTDGGGSYTWTGKVWLPTYTQMSGNANNSIMEGTLFNKYTDNNSRIKYIHEKCAQYNQYCIDYGYSSTTAQYYWMSSADPSGSDYVRSVHYGGGTGNRRDAYTGGIGLAPCIKLPRTIIQTTDLITTYKNNLNKAIAINKKLDYMILDMNLPKALESDLINDYKNRSVKYNDDVMIPKTINFTINTSDGKSLDSSVVIPASKTVEFNPLESTIYGRHVKISDLIGYRVGDMVDSADKDGYYELTSITGDNLVSIEDTEYNAEYIIPQEENEDKEYF